MTAGKRGWITNNTHKKSRFRYGHIGGGVFHSLGQESCNMITENQPCDSYELTEQEAALIAEWEAQQDALNVPSAWEYSQFF